MRSTDRLSYSHRERDSKRFPDFELKTTSCPSLVRTFDPNGSTVSRNMQEVHRVTPPVTETSSMSSSDGFNHESRTGLVSRDDSTDVEVVRVEIGDFETSLSTALTLQALETCKSEIVIPFNMLITFIGWRPIGYTIFDRPSRSKVCGNVAYLILIIGLMMFSYTYQMLACQWRLNINEEDDIGFFTEETAMLASTTQTPNNWSTTTTKTTTMRTSVTSYPNYNDSIDWVTATPAKKFRLAACEHVISTYIIPNILHLCAYLAGFYHYRIMGSENVYALMEKVFQYCSTLVSEKTSEHKIISRMKMFMGFGFLWVLFALATHILYDLAFAKHADSSFALSPQSNTTKRWQVFSYVVFAIDMIGYIIMCIVSMAVIYIYVVHCELIVFYTNSVCYKLQMRSLKLKIACKDILNIKNSIRDMNRSVGIMAAIILTVLAEMIYIGSLIMVKNRYKAPLVISYRILFVIHLIPLFLFPLIQAARVNKHCGKFYNYALEMRTFGYRNASSEDLDSFLLFNMAIHLKATLFKIPIKMSYLVVLFSLCAFVLLILSQVGLFGSDIIV